MQGSLSPSHGLADVVKGVYVGRRSGILTVERDDDRRRLFFERGSFVFSDCSDPAWRLGELLVRQSKISREDLDRILASLTPDRRIGGLFVEQGLLDAAALAEAVEYQITEGVYPCFGWGEGDYRFDPDDHPAPSDIAFAISTASVIMEGVRRIDDPEFVAQAMGSLDRVVTLADDPLLRFQSIFLKPMEGFILSRIDGFLTVDEVCQISPVPEAEVLRCLYGLKSTGILDVRMRDEGAALFEEQGDVASFFVDYVGVEQFIGGSAVAAPGKELSAAEQQELDDILSFAERVGELDHHEVLGVAADADPATIRRAYYRLAKQFHPDRHHRTHLAEYQQKFERIFVRVNEAYETLREDRKPSSTPRRRGGAASSGAPSESEVDLNDPALVEERRKNTAVSRYRDGRQLFDEGDTYGAIQAFRSAVKNQPENPTYHAWLGRALAFNPKWRKEAEEHLLKAIEKEPTLSEHYAQLGVLYSKAGLAAKADRLFGEALRWDAANQTALTARQELSGKKDKGPGLSGTLKNLFKDRPAK